MDSFTYVNKNQFLTLPVSDLWLHTNRKYYCLIISVFNKVAFEGGIYLPIFYGKIDKIANNFLK